MRFRASSGYYRWPGRAALWGLGGFWCWLLGELLDTTLLAQRWAFWCQWLYWQPAQLPGGLWQNFSPLSTKIPPSRLPEVNIDEVTFSLLSMSCHNRPAKADMGVVIVLRNCLRIILASWGPVEPPTVTSGRELWNKRIYVLIKFGFSRCSRLDYQ